MLTKEQWEDAARFAGVVHTHSTHMAGIWIEDAEYNDEIGRRWCPDTDWNDFGPLWVKLERWLMDDTNHDRGTYAKVCVPRWCFDDAQECGTDAEIMQAGLMLAAAIGKTMREGI